MAARNIIGRERELGVIRAWLGTPGPAPRALVVSGEPGIGKTVLWASGVRSRTELAGRFSRPGGSADGSANASLAQAPSQPSGRGVA